MTVARHDAVVGAEELFYCFCLCGRFDDDKIGGVLILFFCFRTTKLHILIYIMCMPSRINKTSPVNGFHRAKQGVYVNGEFILLFSSNFSAPVRGGPVILGLSASGRERNAFGIDP